MSETVLNNTGFSWISKSPEIKKQVRISTEKTYFEKYGSTKIRHGFGSEAFKSNMLNKYGVENPAQHPQSFEKQQLHKNTFKKYKFPSGFEINVQGYEHKAFDFLLSQNYNESDFVLKNRPTIKYFWSILDGFGDNKWHVYHPDIIIKNENKIIEVKSQWTYDGRGKRLNWLSKNLAKQNAALNQGWQFEFLIF